MKILLRDAQTCMWKGINGAWTSALEEAVQFGTLDAAGDEAIKWGERDVVVVLKFEEPSCELALNPVYCVRAVPKNWPPRGESNSALDPQ
jgi:hypothetical protein